MPRVLVDEYDGISEFAHFDPATGDLQSVELVSDVEPWIEANKAKFNEGLGNSKCEFRKVASFPPAAVEIFKKLYGADPFLKGNEDLLRRLLNDPELRHFRTLPGTV